MTQRLFTPACGRLVFAFWAAVIGVTTHADAQDPTQSANSTKWLHAIQNAVPEFETPVPPDIQSDSSDTLVATLAASADDGKHVNPEHARQKSAAVPTRPIRAGHLIGTADVVASFVGVESAGLKIDKVIGKAARRSLFPGQPITAADVGNVQVVKRNDIVELVYERGRLELRAEGRALAPGAIGDSIRVMNLESRIVVNGVVGSQSKVNVQ